jgi:hypothetical protein
MVAAIARGEGGDEFKQQNCTAFTCPYWLGEAVLKSQIYQNQSQDALKAQREIGSEREITSLEARGTIGLGLVHELSSAGRGAVTLGASHLGDTQLTTLFDALRATVRDYCDAVVHSTPVWANTVRAARMCSLSVYRTATSDHHHLSAIARQLRTVCDTEGREYRSLVEYSTEVIAAARPYLRASIDLWDMVAGTEFAVRLGIALCGAITYIQACAEYVVEIRSGKPGAGPDELKTLYPVRSDKCYRPAFGLALTGGLSTETWAWCRILFDRMDGHDSYNRCYADIGNMREYRYTNRDDGWDRLYSQFKGSARDIHWYTCLLGLWYSELKDAVDGAWRRMSASVVQRRLIGMDLWEYVVFCYADCIIQSLLSEDGPLTGHQLLSCFLIKMIDDTLDAEDDVASGELSNGYRTREGTAHARSLRDMTVMYMEHVSHEHRSMADIIGLITGWWYVACKQHGTGGWASDDGTSTGGMELNDIVVADIIDGSTAGLAWWTERTLPVWRGVDCSAWAPWYTPVGPDVAY